MTLPRTLAATLAIAALAVRPRKRSPLTSTLALPPSSRQRERVPGPPTWPANPQPIAPAHADQASDSGIRTRDRAWHRRRPARPRRHRTPHAPPRTHARHRVADHQAGASDMKTTTHETRAGARRVTANAQLLYTLDDAGELASYRHDLDERRRRGPTAGRRTTRTSGWRSPAATA